MKISSSDDIRYSAIWIKGDLEVFYEGESVGKAYVSTLKLAKKILELVVHSKYDLEDIVHFHEISKGMIGMNVLDIDYSLGRQHILYKGKILAGV